MTAWELRLWRQFRNEYGFSTDRLEAATAIAGTAMARSWGSKVTVADLIPGFRGAPRKKLDGRALVAALAGVPGVKATTWALPTRKAG